MSKKSRRNGNLTVWEDNLPLKKRTTLYILFVICLAYCQPQIIVSNYWKSISKLTMAINWLLTTNTQRRTRQKIYVLRILIPSLRFSVGSCPVYNEIVIRWECATTGQSAREPRGWQISFSILTEYKPTENSNNEAQESQRGREVIHLEEQNRSGMDHGLMNVLAVDFDEQNASHN